MGSPGAPAMPNHQINGKTSGGTTVSSIFAFSCYATLFTEVNICPTKSETVYRTIWGILKLSIRSNNSVYIQVPKLGLYFSNSGKTPIMCASLPQHLSSAKLAHIRPLLFPITFVDQTVSAFLPLTPSTPDCLPQGRYDQVL